MVSPEEEREAQEAERQDLSATDERAHDTVNSAPDAASSAPDAVHSAPDAASSAPDAVHSTPDAASSAPDAVHSAPDVAPLAPDAASSTPDVAFSDHDAVPPVPDEASAPEAASLRQNAGESNRAAEAPTRMPPQQRPSFLFFGVVAALSLIADITTKVWAEMTLNQRGFEPLELIADHLSITLAYNRGGAWGLFSTADEVVRKPFFLAVSVAAIAFIVSLYSKIHAEQKALKWGLPLVLGGALGNLSDRITRSQVIDFIDYRAKWVMDLNAWVHSYVPGWTVTDHWPTFNIADVAICIGVGLMAVDMFTHRPKQRTRTAPPTHSGQPEAPSAAG